VKPVECSKPGCEQYVEHPDLDMAQLESLFADPVMRLAFPDWAYWQNLGTLWKRKSFYFFRESQEWFHLLHSGRSQREFFCHHSCGREMWRALPDEITIYRGASDERLATGGIHWSLLRYTAENFAAALDSLHSDGPLDLTLGDVAKMTVRKSDCIYRGNILQEVIYLPNFSATPVYAHNRPFSYWAEKLEHETDEQERQRNTVMAINTAYRYPKPKQPCCYNALTCTHY
jgi:hypothetical protein